MGKKSRLILAFSLFLVGETEGSLIPEEDRICVNSLVGRDWAPIRMGVIFDVPRTTAETRSSLLTLIRERVFPRMSSFWSGAMKVRRMRRPLTVTRDCRLENGVCVQESESVCGARHGFSVPIPANLLSAEVIHQVNANGQTVTRRINAGRGENVDFMLLVTVQDRPNCGDLRGGMMASAVACRWDECHRPVMGAVNICPQAVDPHSEESVTTLFSTLTHEMTHVFGFTSDVIPNMRHANGVRRLPLATRKEVFYTCKIEDGRFQVKWDIDPTRYRGQNMYRHVFPDGLIEVTSDRGATDNCRCPIYSDREYTADDIRHCLKHKNECNFALVTPRAAEMARVYFGCHKLAGAELENQTAGPSCQFLESHWKERIFGNELMTSTMSTLHAEISPVTFGFLEDTGWYRMNYMMTTSLVPGATFGFKAGCAFARRPCISSRGHVVKQEVDAKTFCTARSAHNLCSADGTHKVQCNAIQPGSRTIPQHFLYTVNGGSMYDDFCPRLVSLSGSLCSDRPGPTIPASPWEMFGSSSRCLDITQAGAVIGSCVQVECSRSAESYKVILTDNGQAVTLPHRCRSAGQTLSFGDKSINCLDPKIVCSMRDFPHIASPMVATVAGAKFNHDSRLEAQAIADAMEEDGPEELADVAQADTKSGVANLSVLVSLVVVATCL